MTVHEIMTCQPVCCHSDTNLATAAALLWERDCGALPIVDQENRPTGMITDRDICIAVGTRNKPATEIRVGEVMMGRVYSCDADADIHEALASMERNHVRRLIITAGDGRLCGILSIDDIVLNVQWSDHKEVELSFLDVVRVLRKVTYPAQPCPAWMLALSNGGTKH
jgi:CBS domain-containing protein